MKQKLSFYGQDFKKMLPKGGKTKNMSGELMAMKLGESEVAEGREKHNPQILRTSY